MRAIIYERGIRKWATDDGDHLIGIQKDEQFTYPDETTEWPNGGPAMIRWAILRRREIDIARNVINLHVEHVE